MTKLWEGNSSLQQTRLELPQIWKTVNERILWLFPKAHPEGPGWEYTHAVVAAKFSVLLDFAMTVNAIEKILVKAIIA